MFFVCLPEGQEGIWWCFLPCVSMPSPVSLCFPPENDDTSLPDRRRDCRLGAWHGGTGNRLASIARLCDVSRDMMNFDQYDVYVHCQIKSFVASQILLWSSLNHFDLSLWALEGALWASNLMAHWGPLEHRTPKGRVLSWGFACLVWKWFKVSNLGKQCLDRLSTATKDIKRL